MVNLKNEVVQSTAPQDGSKAHGCVSRNVWQAAVHKLFYKTDQLLAQLVINV